jgi:diguanylate cyclase (GGDEF)-like protein
VDRLAGSLTAVLGDEPVNDLEVHLRPRAASEAELRACQISLRPLTDHAGVVSGAIGCLSDVTDAARLRRELELRATVDALTGCLNRAATLELLEMTLRDHATLGAGMAVVFVDLDSFKTVNDRYGHATGDAVLIAAAQRIQTATRERDQLGRLGGDEFLVLCPDVSHAKGLDIVARLHRALHDPLTVAHHEIALGASLGLAWTEHETSADALIAEADEAMYAAKATRQSLSVLNASRL